MNSCCGKKRAMISTDRRMPMPEATRDAPTGAATNSGVIYYQYLGGNMLSVLGQATGQTYRFVGYGALLPVDIRDHGTLARYRELKQLSL